MPKLFYTPTSCGAASFIAAHIAGVSLDAETVDIRAHKTASGADFYAINPKGNVPTVLLEDGTVLNENAATLQFIADLKPGTVAPAPGTQARAVIINWLSYTGTEVHTSIGGLFNPAIAADVKAHLTANANKKLDYLNKTFAAHGAPQFLGGSATPTIADFYLYIVLSWVPFVGLSFDAYPNVKAYWDLVAGNEGVKKAHAFIATNPAKTI